MVNDHLLDLSSQSIKILDSIYYSLNDELECKEYIQTSLYNLKCFYHSWKIKIEQQQLLKQHQQYIQHQLQLQQLQQQQQQSQQHQHPISPSSSTTSLSSSNNVTSVQPCNNQQSQQPNQQSTNNGTTNNLMISIPITNISPKNTLKSPRGATSGNMNGGGGGGSGVNIVGTSSLMGSVGLKLKRYHQQHHQYNNHHNTYHPSSTSTTPSPRMMTSNSISEIGPYHPISTSPSPPPISPSSSSSSSHPTPNLSSTSLPTTPHSFSSPLPPFFDHNNHHIQSSSSSSSPMPPPPPPPPTAPQTVMSPTLLASHYQQMMRLTSPSLPSSPASSNPCTPTSIPYPPNFLLEDQQQIYTHPPVGAPIVHQNGGRVVCLSSQNTPTIHSIPYNPSNIYSTAMIPQEIMLHNQQQQPQQHNYLQYSPYQHQLTPINWKESKLKDFLIHSEVIGSGSFGTVRLASHIQTNQLFCMKILNRSRVNHIKQVEHILNEKNIMFSISSPFIVKLYATFKTTQNLYFLMEYVTFGELFNYIRHDDFKEPIAKLVLAEIIIGLQVLHQKNIIYRDLKPENILVDSYGHIKLADFGFARLIDKKANRAYSMCGTFDYMAPEVMIHNNNNSNNNGNNLKSYDKQVDWWAVGIVLYEMLTGFPPFSNDRKSNETNIYNLSKYINEQNQSCCSIVQSHQPSNTPTAGTNPTQSLKIEYPKEINPIALDLLSYLLDSNPDRRYGGAQCPLKDIHQHPFFEGIDWNSIKSLSHPGPLIPFLSPHNQANIVSSPFYDPDISHNMNMASSSTPDTDPFYNFEDYTKQ